MQQYSDVVLVASVPGGPVRAPAAASVQVNITGGAAATLYSDNGVTPRANPIVADSSGEYSFYAANGTYDLVISVTGFTTETKTAAVQLFDAAASSGAAGIGFLPSGTGALADTVQGRLRKTVFVTDFIPVALHAGILARTETSDLSTYIQAAIDYINGLGGGVVWFSAGSYYCNVVLKEGVTLEGGSGGFGYLPSAIGGVRLVAFATGVVVDTPAGLTLSVGVCGLNVSGLGAGTAAKGIRFRNVNYGVIKRTCVSNFADEGILTVAGAAFVIEDILALNCLLNRTRVAKTGAVDIGGTDPQVSRIEATCSQSALSDANAYLCGIVVRSTNGFFSNVVGEISDDGIHVVSTASLNRFENCRADLNWGHGWNVIGSANQFSNCTGINNSQETSNTYDNWQFNASSSNNQTANCQAYSGVAKVAKYGFNDLVNSSTNKNQHTNPYSVGAGTANYLNNSSAGSGFSWPSGNSRTLTANSTTPSVEAYENFITANGSGTVITDFTLGVAGQKITILCNDANTTIQHNGATITLFNSGNRKLRSGVAYTFRKDGVIWREIRTVPLGVTADVGNAAKSLQADIDGETQIWNTAISADRAVTLSTTGAYAGAKFRIVRTTNATGAFNLNVGTGPLKAMATPGSSCEVTYDGSAWVLTDYGVL